MFSGKSILETILILYIESDFNLYISGSIIILSKLLDFNFYNAGYLYILFVLPIESIILA